MKFALRVVAVLVLVVVVLGWCSTGIRFGWRISRFDFICGAMG